jgi:uncharacterized membrane protein
MLSWFQFWLFLHIVGAVFAFGPGFMFPLIGAMTEAEPIHGNFGLRLMGKIEDRVVIPIALTLPVTGALMIVAGNISLAHFWLIAGIVLYLVVITFTIAVQRTTIHKMTHLTAQAAALPMTAGPGATPVGPSPEFIALRTRAQVGGAFLGLMVLVILALMIFRPGS